MFKKAKTITSTVLKIKTFYFLECLNFRKLMICYCKKKPVQTFKAQM